MADLVITAANVIAGSNATVDNNKAGEAITAGQAIYPSPDTGKWMLADNNSATAEARKATAIALNNAAPNQPISFLKSGDITIGAALTPGAAYYLSATPGGVCAFDDLVTGNYVCQLGLAKSATVLAVDIQFPGVAL